GGPHAMYTGIFSHEMQTLAAQGYAVLWVNPRGSMGYGQEFARACRGDFAGGDYRDLLEAVDYALATYDFLDETRLGIGGGSYGGVMTNWIVAHTHRFKAAVTQRCISNWLSLYGTSDIGISYVEGVIGGNPTEHADMLWARSPLAHAHKIETPLLIMHGEQDYRTPIAQAEELYTTLKRYGKTTKLIRYPGSNHTLLKSGKPSLRVDSFEQVNAWFNQYLKDGEGGA
ncbi:S9 family peptidase, partial [Paenibacillus tundrae]|uniref:S9 family peptidase n=1 Tax=Paenibacillus tundrae TaxID=528187 RepID=UPI0022A9A1AA